MNNFELFLLLGLLAAVESSFKFGKKGRGRYKSYPIASSSSIVWPASSSVWPSSGSAWPSSGSAWPSSGSAWPSSSSDWPSSSSAWPSSSSAWPGSVWYRKKRSNTDCKTVVEEFCWEEPVCETTKVPLSPTTPGKNTCTTVDKQQCTTTQDTVWETVEWQECTDTKVKVPREQCTLVDLVTPAGESSATSQRQCTSNKPACKTVQEKVSKQVPREECSTVPLTSCTDGSTPAAGFREVERCFSQTHKRCKDVEKEVCED